MGSIPLMILGERALPPARSVHRQDEPTRLSLGMVASQQCQLLFHPAIDSTSNWMFGNNRFAVIRLAAFEDSIDGVQQFALDRHQRLQASFVSRFESLVKRSQMWIEAHRRQDSAYRAHAAGGDCRHG